MLESYLPWIIALWVAAIGGAVGSFLNVVVYRVPAGMNLSQPGSHCPKCKHPIRWYDNVPVFGWLMLGGRCRDCGVWIPVRYPAVEACVAGLFLLIVLVEGLSFGANLPARPAGAITGLVYPALAEEHVAGLLAWHLLLLCTLLSTTLIRFDGQAVPAKLFAPALVTGLVGSILGAFLHPQPAMVLEGGVSPGWVDGLAGAASGAAIGWALARLVRQQPDTATTLAATTVGLYLGWQATVVILPVAVACHGLTWITARRWQAGIRVSLLAWIGVGTILWICNWRPVAECLFATGG